MDDEMIERCAKAIGNSLYGYVDDNDTPNTYAMAKSVAIDCIKAMREPTEKMIEAGSKVDTAQLEKDTWQAMIDAVINE